MANNEDGQQLGTATAAPPIEPSDGLEESSKLPEDVLPDAGLGEQEKTPDGEPQEDGEVDWKAKATETQAALDKERADRKSFEGGVRSQRERDRIIDEIREDVAGNRSTTALLNLLVKHLPAEDSEGLKQEREAVETQVAQTSEQREFSIEIAALEEDFLDMAGDELDLRQQNTYDDSRLGNALNDWNRARQNGKITEVRSAARSFRGAIKAVLADQKKTQKKEAERDQVDEDRRSGKLKADSGRTAPGAGGGDQELVNKMAQPGVYVSPEDVVRAGKAMDRGIYPKLE